jgi:hypothetical protein
MAASRKAIHDLMDRLEPRIARGFAAAVARIKSRAQLNALTRAIEVGDIDGAFRAAGYRPGSWNDVIEQTRAAYIEGGTFTTNADVPARFGMEFDWRNPRSEAWLAAHSSQLVTWITEEQREGIRTVLTAGMRDGRNPRSVALDIVGRIDPRTQRRTGGIVGLNAPQTEAVMNARTQLENLDAGYFDRKRRDRRFDSMVRRAIENDTPLRDADIDRIVGRYSDRLLKLRGDTIGRTETLQALNEAADESLRQVIDEGLAPPDAVVRVWDATGDSRTRETHAAMDGQEVGPNEPFTSGSGAQLMHPGDGSLGAGASEIINCRCVVTHKIDFIAVEAG